MTAKEMVLKAGHTNLSLLAMQGSLGLTVISIAVMLWILYQVCFHDLSLQGISHWPFINETPLQIMRFRLSDHPWTQDGIR